MPKIHFFPCLIVFALLLCSCSIEVNQTAIAASPSAETPVATSAPSLFPVTKVPVTWTDLKLTGKLLYLSSLTDNGSPLATIRMLDLTSGELATVFTAPAGAWIYYMTVSPDAKNIVISYIPPAQGTAASNRVLYMAALKENMAFQPLFPSPSLHDHYVQAEWSPDGKYIYYAHYNDTDEPDEQLNPPYDLVRLSYPDLHPETISAHAFWPRLSADSAKLVYIALEPASGANDLVIAKTDGSDPQKVKFSGPWIPELMDAPIFSPDEKSILFSAPGPSQSYRPNWLDKVLGVQIAHAHNVPSDWWSVPVEGGVPTRLTHIQEAGLFASLSSDGQHLFSLSAEGIFVMQPDGSNVTQLIFEPGVHGTVSWIP